MNVYDFDKTIYAGDSTADFIVWCLRRKPALAFRLLPGAAAFGGYLCRRVSKTRFKERLYRFLRFVPDIDAWVEAFWNQHQEGIQAWYRLRQQPEDVVISASPEFLLRPICRRLGIVHLLASQVDKHTGLYSGENCHGQEKVRRFRQAFPEGQVTAFYSDSRSDDPMARLAQEAWLVDGDRLRPW